MQAGKLNKRVTLQAPTVTKGASGGVVKGWSEVATVWAAIRHFSGNERAASSAGGQVAEARVEITIRHRAAVTPQIRVLHGSTVYNVRHVNNFMEKNETLILTCETGVNDG